MLKFTRYPRSSLLSIRLDLIRLPKLKPNLTDRFLLVIVDAD
jgi:hypothetical protein